MLPRIAVLLVSLVHVYSLPHVHDADEPPVLASLPGSWSHPEDHHVRNLFKRADSATTFPAVGSPGPFIVFSAMTFAYHAF